MQGEPGTPSRPTGPRTRAPGVRRAGRAAQGLRRGAAALLAVLGLLGAGGALAQSTVEPVPLPWPPVLQAQAAAALDDPMAALAPAQAALAAATDPADRFWRALAVARLQYLLELDEATAASLQVAADALARVPSPGPEMPRWLRYQQLSFEAVTRGGTEVLRELGRLRDELEHGAPSVLLCETIDVEAWLLYEVKSLDEAWLAAESLDHCGHAVGRSSFVAQAAAMMGQIQGASERGSDAALRAELQFRRALEALQAEPSRFQRSLTAYAAGLMLSHQKQWGLALPYLEQALALSRDLQDRAGVAAAQIAIAGTLLEQRRFAQVLAPIGEAMALLDRLGGGETRMLAAYEVRIRALAALGRPNVLDDIAHAELLAADEPSPLAHASLSRAIAEGQASQGRYEKAYQAMLQAHRWREAAQQVGQDAQVLRLQARYESARHEAELATLRHREETARLTLATQAATQRVLWLVVTVLGMAMLAALAAGVHLWRRRRELADLALRDELTGLPNRRAVAAYGRAQFAQSRRLGLPMTVALIDMDHFKRVNDLHGHAGGDQVLQALAQSVTPLLRAQDRLGRWGGEEFVLVMPGTQLEELPAVYARLRQAFAAAAVPALPQPHGLSFSMGGAEMTSAVGGFEALVDEADARLYVAKAAGRDTCR